MFPFSIVVVLLLTVLFIVISVIPLLPGQSDMDSNHLSSTGKKKSTHPRMMRK
jgi:hypothetical protein